MSTAKWEPILDIAALNRKENRSWVFDFASMKGFFESRMLIYLSDGGRDATVVREFDLEKCEFCAAGFRLEEETVTFVSWLDYDRVFISTDFGEGSLTMSGYPRIVKCWQRGTPLATAREVFRGETTDSMVRVNVHRFQSIDKPLIVFSCYKGFWDVSTWILLDDGIVERVKHKSKDFLGFWFDQVYLILKEPCGDLETGTLVAGERGTFISNGYRSLQVLFRPTRTRFLQQVILTGSAILCQVLDDVVGGVVEYTYDPDEARWSERVVSVPSPGSLRLKSLWDVHTTQPSELDDSWLCWYSDMITPWTIFRYTVGSTGPPELIHRNDAKFDAGGLHIRQYFANSTNDVRIPYFVCSPVNQVNPLPCLMYGYGGFETSTMPEYCPIVGLMWLARGNVYVLTCVRGGGEYGPDWHSCAVRENFQLRIDDFNAIARDLCIRGITTQEKLASQGESNGGALVAACAMQQPDLFKEVVSQCALLDMKQYSKWSCGASWIDEYGDPDVLEDWLFLKKWSPCHNVPSVLQNNLPFILFTSSTYDDRVHPDHSRNMMLRLWEKGHGDTSYLYENIEGGHGNAADNEQRARLYAMEFHFLLTFLA